MGSVRGDFLLQKKKVQAPRLKRKEKTNGKESEMAGEQAMPALKAITA